MSRYELFDRSRIRTRGLSERGHEMTPQQVWSLDASFTPYRHPRFEELVNAVIDARRNQRPVILMMGAHPIKLGLSRFLIDMMRRGWLTHLATNGAGLIHDFELAWGQGTSESVSKWIRVGQFGLWRETGIINEIVRRAWERGEGLGEALGRSIVEQQLPHADLSLAAAGWQLGIPVTSHISIGSDIIHAHANCSGAAMGAASYTDFLIFARAIEKLEGGVFINLGTSVTGPEVYLKALSMARNLAHQDGRTLSKFTTAVFDLVPLPEDYAEGTPSKDQALYYYRPWKTILVRTVADGGRSIYFRGDHQQTIPTLWRDCINRCQSIAESSAA